MFTGVKIPCIEARDIYNSHKAVYPDAAGYTLMYADGSDNLSLYGNALDDSLDLRELRSVYKKVFRNERFSFCENGIEYSRQVVCLTFRFEQKEFAHSGKGLYTAAGVTRRNPGDPAAECVFSDGERVTAVQTEVECPAPDSRISGMLPDCFCYSDGCYRIRTKPRTAASRGQIRAFLYENGFTLDGIRYIRWKRSSGSAREGKCLFINEKLFAPVRRWESCGITPRKGVKTDLAAYEAYISLTLSSIVGTLSLRAENILVIDDAYSCFTVKAAGVRLMNGMPKARVRECAVSNSLFDGQSLLDESAFPEKFRDRSMLLLRQRMFKSAAFKTRIRQFFEDSGITGVSQLKGLTLAKTLDDIKLITTPSSIKFTKFGTARLWLERLSGDFGIVKCEKDSRHFTDSMVSAHYQLINTLFLKDEQTGELLEQPFDYIRKLISEPAVLRAHLKMTADKDCDPEPVKNRSMLALRLIGLSDRYIDTKLCRDLRSALVKKLVRELSLGHIPVNGNYSVLFGNGVEMLRQSIGKFDGTSVLGQDCIYTRRFPGGALLVGSRSPHVCAGNILKATNTPNELIDRYFPLSEQIVCVSSIGNNILQRLNGADFDSDTVMLTDSAPMLPAVPGENRAPVPTCLIDAEKIKREYTPEQLADLDLRTADNRIGEIINLSQYLNSLYQHKRNCGAKVRELDAIYLDICVLAVLSNIEIDKAKKEYDFSTGDVLRQIKEKYTVRNSGGQQIKPFFFSVIAKEKGLGTDGCFYKYFDTPMDMLERRIRAFREELRKAPDKRRITVSEITDSFAGKYNFQQYYYDQKKKIISRIRQANARLKELYTDYAAKDSETKARIREKGAALREQCISEASTMIKNKKLACLMLRALDEKENSDLSHRLAQAVLGSGNESVFALLGEQREEVGFLAADPGGDITLFGKRFKVTRRKDNCSAATDTADTQPAV